VVEVSVAGVGRLQALVDTGATSTVIEFGALPQAMLKGIRKWEGGWLTGAGGDIFSQ